MSKSTIKSVWVSIRLEPDLYKRLTKAAKKAERSISWKAREFIKKGLK